MEIVSLIVAAAVTHGLDPNLLKAVCYKESRHRNVNTKDHGSISYGACQIKRIAAKQVGMGSANLLDPETSIQVAAMYLKQKINECESIQEAIGAFNTGRCLIPKSGYSNDVMQLYKEFEDGE